MEMLIDLISADAAGKLDIHDHKGQGLAAVFVVMSHSIEPHTKETVSESAIAEDPVLVGGAGSQPSSRSGSSSSSDSSGAHPPIPGRPSRSAAIKEARAFVYTQSFATLATVNQKGQFEGFPAAQIEYYADSGEADASLLFIRVDMSSAFRNISQGSPASLAIRTGDQPHAETPLDVAGHARIILYGEFSSTTPSPGAQHRFFELHPDAKHWAPGTPGFHHTEWVKFTIQGIYYIGGFGDTKYIGQLPVDKYVDTPLPPPEPSTNGLVSRFLSLAFN